MKKLLLISILFLIANVPYVYCQNPKTEITGKQMVIKDSGKKTIFTGNAKVTRENNTVVADKMIYYKDKEYVDAMGNIKFSTKNDDGSVVNAYSQKAYYNIKDYSGKLWDGNPKVEYITKDSKDKVFLYAQEIELNKDFESVVAKDNVRIVSSSGTITSDNAYLNKENKSLLMKKDKNRPTIDVQQEDKEAHFKADELLLLYEQKTIQLNDNVEGKIKIEDTSNLEKLEKK